MTNVEGIRRNVSKISYKERDIFRDAIIAMHREFRFPGIREDVPIAGGVSFWFKQDEIHQGTHVHRGPAFLTWHRELCNKFEGLLRAFNDGISLHYWDWNENPWEIETDNNELLNLFDERFMGNGQGLVVNPWLQAGFYDPTIQDDRFRGGRDDKEHQNPFDPPKEIVRTVPHETLRSFVEKNNDLYFYTDEEIIEAPTFREMRRRLERVHNSAHSYIGGTIGDDHTAFRDPFVFLIHSNVDRLFAMWQYKNKDERLNPDTLYGEESETTARIEESGGEKAIIMGILSQMSPWNGSFDPNPEVQQEIKKVRPWTSPEQWNIKYTDTFVKDSKHPSIVFPRLYDTMIGDNL